jgi:hypothetical protein
MFADMGGASAVDVTNLGPDEEKALRMIIDPTWKPRS